MYQSRLFSKKNLCNLKFYSSLPLPSNILPSGIDSSSDDFLVNSREMNRHITSLHTALSGSRAGGGASAIAKHVARGKLTARDRISTLLDPGSPFLELSPLAGHELYPEPNGSSGVPSGGIVTGIGRVSGVLKVGRGLEAG